ncbi:MAG: hypothetical protein BGO43_14985 [Gammaproteobacteria bacterium 39-13]|nr:hypothetical protein [Gammaproteobacteria bacterium]OJV86243.1 MAG: hypothetical protein BGO43_14985 [Gammaproteobacteria bacterium 39-13]
MQELKAEDLDAVHGGIIITTAVATLIASGVIATIYLINSLVNLYIVNHGGQTTPQPNSTDLNQLGNDIKTVATVLPNVVH